MNTEMENQILQGIIEDTRTKLNHSDTDLNILDLLQTYDYYISKLTFCTLIHLLYFIFS
jgi:hypothetical protein